MIFLKVFIIFQTLVFSCFGASFIFSPFERQVQDADAAVMGEIVDSSFKKLHTGEIVTEYTIDLEWKAGLRRSDAINTSGFKVIVPGGIWQGINYQVSGAPRFSSDELVFLLLRKSSYGYSVLNLGLGKYFVEKEKRSEKITLKSSVFPEHPRLGSISFEEVNDVLEDKFTIFEEVTSHLETKATTASNENLSRLPASKERAPSSLTQSGYSDKSIFWPFFMLVFLACLKPLSRHIFK